MRLCLVVADLVSVLVEEGGEGEIDFEYSDSAWHAVKEEGAMECTRSAAEPRPLNLLCGLTRDRAMFQTMTRREILISWLI